MGLIDSKIQESGSKDLRRLDGKVAFVVGAGSSGPGWGTGKAIAVHLARLGAKVFGVDINASAADETGAIISDEGGQFASFVGDITKTQGVVDSVQSCVRHFGNIQIVINNLGLAHIGGLAETQETDWDRILRANLTTAFLVSKEALPSMLAAKGGSIINISSLASNRWTGVPLIAYASSKAAMNQMTQYVAMQYAAKGIRANAIIPGMLLTPMMLEPMKLHFGTDVSQVMKTRDSLCPTGKMGTAWDIAYAAGFLASDEAAYINGVLLPVDGGMSCQTRQPDWPAS